MWVFDNRHAILEELYKSTTMMDLYIFYWGMKIF